MSPYHCRFEIPAKLGNKTFKSEVSTWDLCIPVQSGYPRSTEEQWHQVKDFCLLRKGGRTISLDLKVTPSFICWLVAFSWSALSRPRTSFSASCICCIIERVRRAGWAASQGNTYFSPGAWGLPNPFENPLATTQNSSPSMLVDESATLAQVAHQFKVTLEPGPLCTAFSPIIYCLIEWRR